MYADVGSAAESGGKITGCTDPDPAAGAAYPADYERPHARTPAPAADVGAGMYEDVVTAAESVVKNTGCTDPDPATAAVYPAYYERYRALYPALAAGFRAMDAVVSEQVESSAEQ